MRHEHSLSTAFTVGLALVTFGLPALASAQAPSRAARVLSLMSGDAVGVLVTRDRVFVPDGTAAGLSACAGPRCAPVVSSEACTVPRCPGSGTLLSLGAPIADVSDMPTDRDGFNRTIESLRGDPALSALVWSYGAHPDPTPTTSGPPRWIERGRTDTAVWELGAYGIGGGLGMAGLGYAGGEVSGGFRFTWDAHDDDDDFLAIMFGNVLGLDLRVRTVALLPPQGEPSWATTVGVAPAMGYANDHESFRLPTVYSVLLPEVGMALREGRDAICYLGWSVPVTFLLEEHLGVEARATVLLMDDWIPGDDAEVVLSLGLGLVAR